MQKQIKILQAQIQDLKHHVHNYTEAELRNKPLPNKWSKVELLGHLIDSARINIGRFTAAALKESPVEIIAYAQDDFVRINAYQRADINDLVYLWQSLNMQLIHLWKHFPKGKPGFIVYGEVQSVEWWATDYVEHSQHHLNHFFKNKKETGHGLSKYHVTLQEAVSHWNNTEDLDILVSQFGDLEIEYYKPHKIDLQKPHDRDEIYVVISGSGKYERSGSRVDFQPHDVLFAKAGEMHRFVDFTKDFAVWVVFYGLRR